MMVAVVMCGAAGLPVGAAGSVINAIGPRMAWADDDSASGKDSQSDHSVTLTLVSSSATISSTSGYSASLKVTNGTDHRLDVGTITAFVNDRYVFASSLLMQDWADGKALIDTPRVLAHAQVQALDPGASQVVGLSSDADSLAGAFDYWGPKPVQFQYTAGTDPNDAGQASASGNEPAATLHSFVTRTRDDMGLNNTPAINMVVAMPLTTSGWQANEDATNVLLRSGKLPDGVTDATVITPSADAGAQTKSVTTLIASHPRIQAVADATFASNAPGLSVAASLQPDGFDISAYGQLTQLPWADAGMDTAAWKAGADTANATTTASPGTDGQTGASDASNETGDSTASDGTDQSNASGTAATQRTNIAWQGQADWTSHGLAIAKQQGYDVVVAESGFDPAYPDAVSTGKTTVNTDSGDVTVLVAQKELSTLAQGNATSADATGESSSAGQINRFIAQTALYQMERPYESRTLLVSLKDAKDLGEVSAIMQSLEKSSWVSLSTLQSLLDASTDESSTYALESDDATTIKGTVADSIKSRINALAGNGGKLGRFATNVLDVSPIEKAAEEDASKTNDPSALARQDANDAQSKTSQAAVEWMDVINTLHVRIARLSMSMAAGADQSLLDIDDKLVTGLYGGVVINPSDSVNTVSETGSIPVTVSNQLPFAVKIRVTADTDSDSIVVSQDVTDVAISAKGESQTTFPLRVTQTGRATATFTLTDRNDKPFGASTTSAVHSVLRISDMSGTAILVLAALLGVMGLWRQFTRKKDPDQ